MAERTAFVDVERYIDGYEVIRRVGAGGWAQVYLCREPGTDLHRALKIQHPRPLTDSMMLTIKREYRAVSRLDHPHIVKVHAYGVYDDRPFLVMDFVEGQSLSAYLDAHFYGPKDARRIRRVVALGIQVADALHHIHGHQIVHRDLKPDNILVTEAGQAQILDFGVAQDGAEANELTDSGTVMGTLAYASPEQVSGREVDSRTDLYSLGIILYELLTGSRPFQAEHVAAYIMKHIGEMPQDPRVLNPNLPEDLAQLVLRLLAKRPEERPQSGGELHEALSKIAVALEPWGQAVVVRPTGSVPLFNPAFSGRKGALEVLRQRLARLESGHSGALFLTGGTGVGKGRLLQEATAVARGRGLSAISARFYSEDGRDNGAFDDLVQRLGRLEDSNRRSPLKLLLGPAAAVLASHFPGLAHLGEGVPLPTNLGPEDERRALIRGLRELLRQACRSPTMITLEGAQWADASSVRLLGELFEAVMDGLRTENPLLIVVAFRSDEVGPGHALHDLAYAPRPFGPVIDLKPLTPEEVGEMVASMLGKAPGLATLAQALHQLTLGNPLFIAETIRSLVEGGYLESPRGGGETRWRLRGDLSELPIHGDLNDALQQRLASLPAAIQQGLGVASVLGRSFTAQLLQSVADLSEEALLDLLDLALARRLLTERQTDQGPVYGFSHPKLRAVAYEQLTPEGRRAWHLRAAKLLRAEVGDTQVELVAAQYYAGGDHQEGAAILLGASEAFIREGRTLQAWRLLGRAEECLHAGGEAVSPAVRIGVHRRLGTVLTNQGRGEEALAHFREAYKLSAQDALKSERGPVLYQMARFYQQSGNARQASVFYHRALKHFSEDRDFPNMLGATSGLAGTLWSQGQLDRARKLYQEAQQLALRLKDVTQQATATQGLGLVAVAEDDFEGSLRHFADARNLYRRVGREMSALQCDVNAASSQRMTGELGPGRSRVRTAREGLESLGHRIAASQAYLVEAEIAADIGDLIEVPELLDKANALGSMITTLEPMAGLIRARYLLLKGRIGPGLEQLIRALNRAEALNMADVAFQLRCQLAQAQVLIGSPGECLTTLEAIDAPEGSLRELDEATLKMLRAQALIAQGDARGARGVAAGAADGFRRHHVRQGLLRSLLVVGRADLQEGDVVGASAAAGEALDCLGFMRRGLKAADRKAFDALPEVGELATLWEGLKPVMA